MTSTKFSGSPHTIYRAVNEHNLQASPPSLEQGFIPGGTGVDTADALPRLQAVAPLHDPLVGYRELAEAVEVALLLKEVPRDQQYCNLVRKS